METELINVETEYRNADRYFNLCIKQDCLHKRPGARVWWERGETGFSAQEYGLFLLF